jgi:hypothetical protein
LSRSPYLKLEWRLVKCVDNTKQEVQYGDDEEAGREAPLHKDEAHHGNHGDASGGQQVVEEIRVVAGGLPGSIRGKNSVVITLVSMSKKSYPGKYGNATERRKIVQDSRVIACGLPERQ